MANEAKSLSQLKPQHKVLLAVASMALLAGGFYYIKIMDIDAQIETSVSQHRKAEGELKEYEKLTGDVKLEDMQKQYADVLKKSEDNRKIVPEEPKLEKFMAALEDDAVESGLRVERKKPQLPLAHEGYTGYPMEYVVSGSFPSLVKFFLLISQPDRRLVNIRKLEIEFDKREEKEAAKKKDGGGDVLSFSDKKVKRSSAVIASFEVEAYSFFIDPNASDPTKKKKK